jgi:hypothetical protein
MAAGADDLVQAFDRAREATLGLPEVETGTWYGTPSLNVRGKSLMRVKDPDTLVVMCPVEEKEMLLQAAPDIYFETDHYKGWPAILVRVSAVGADELRHRLEMAWRMKAPRRLVRAFDEAKREEGRIETGGAAEGRD